MKLLLRLADFALHEIDDFFGFRDRVVLCNRADDGFGPVEQDHRGRDAFAFGVRDDLRFSVSVDMRDGREGRAKIDSDCFAIAHVLERALWISLPGLVGALNAVFMPPAVESR